MGRIHKVAVCGEKLIAERCLEYLHQREDTQICAIIASPTDWQADLISWGAKRGIKVFTGNINNHYDELQGMRLDYIFSFQYRPLLKPPLLKLPARGCINLHFGKLPQYGGCYPIAWAILNGEEEAGATLHIMSENFDEGDILAQSSEAFTTETTARELFDLMTLSAFALFKENYFSLINGYLTPRRQDLSKKRYYAKDSIDFARDSRINWQKRGVEIQRQICAFTFQPFQQASSLLILPGDRQERVFISQTRLSSPRDLQSAREDVGRILAIEENGAILVVTGDTHLLSIAGINDQAAADFIRSLPGSITEIRFSS